MIVGSVDDADHYMVRHILNAVGLVSAFHTHTPDAVLHHSTYYHHQVASSVGHSLENSASCLRKVHYKAPDNSLLFVASGSGLVRIVLVDLDVVGRHLLWQLFEVYL